MSSKFSVNQPDDFDMSHQFPSSVPGRSVGRPFHGRPSSPHVASSDDWTTQQSLFLGSNTVPYRWQVSLSPQESSPHTAGSFIFPSPQAQSIEVHSPFSGRVMYPLPTYQCGNPGYYYDPFRYPNCVGSQTIGPPSSHPSTFVPTCTPLTPSHTTTIDSVVGCPPLYTLSLHFLGIIQQVIGLPLLLSQDIRPIIFIHHQCLIPVLLILQMPLPLI